MKNLAIITGLAMLLALAAPYDAKAQPTTEVKKLTASDADNSDSFGWSVAVSGDTAVVGARWEDGAGTDRGAAYVFERDHPVADDWGEVTKLTASDAEDYDRFGIRVAVSGDTAIVGAFNEDGAGTDRGAAYVFERDQGGPGNWGEVTKLAASDAQDNDWFGWSVALSGDTAVVGARHEAGAGTGRGAAYVFERDQGGPGNWGEVTKLTASDAQDYDEFGFGAAVSGDTAVVGAYYEDGAGSNRGAAYVFERDQGGPGNWGEVTKLTASDAGDNDNFGCSVALSGETTVVGARLEDGAGSQRGAAYVFERDQGGPDNWGEVTKLTASDAEDYDRFGIRVAVSGDTAIVGAFNEDGAGSDRGAAYVFERDQGGPGNWGEATKLTASDAEDNDVFGWSVALSGDTAAVGAYQEDGAGSDRGAAYVFGPAVACIAPFTPIVAADADCDSAQDDAEVGGNPVQCGMRAPDDPWDFYNVPVPTLGNGGTMADRGDFAVSILNDVLAVLEYSGTSDEGPPNAAGRDYDDDIDGDTHDDGLAYDRSVGAVWTGPPDGAVTILVDVLAVLAQSGHSCPPPAACLDWDEDGWDGCGGYGNPVPGCDDPCDCDDEHPGVNPAASEACNDAEDNDCDGLTDCDDSDCSGDPACSLPNGALCTSDNQCVSAHCVDGYCCDGPCSGICEACDGAMTSGGNGECMPIVPGTDPESECPGEETCPC